MQAQESVTEGVWRVPVGALEGRPAIWNNLSSKDAHLPLFSLGQTWFLRYP